MFSLSVHIISVFAFSLIFILEKKDELREAAVAYPYPDIKFLLISFTSMEACTAHLQCMFRTKFGCSLFLWLSLKDQVLSNCNSFFLTDIQTFNCQV